MNLGSEHLSARQRLFTRLEPFPSKGLFKRFLDYLMYGIGFVQWIALLPQIISVYVDGNTRGISVATWFLLAGFNALWTLYGLVHQERAIVTANFLMMAGDLAVAIGALIH